MSKIILFFILIISLNGSNTIIPEDINVSKIYSMNIKPECGNLFKDFAYFYNKSKESTDGLKSRWIDIYKVYKIEFLKCNTSTIDANKSITQEVQFYAPNPLNKVQQTNIK